MSVNPSILQTTLALLTVNSSSQTVPHTPLCSTSTRPWYGVFPPTRRILVADTLIQISFLQRENS
ncbi:hypothetical protein DPMN_034132 [Dreissena polymorpha]|uniref:Uncharacterized protein n=1 Tax=Dreissena polymorpha TaxID=45954 RepID=A0A9D4M720_DREPO|nr:hypothetical protein DPMN_034132 [Dreissena polymorpha]